MTGSRIEGHRAETDAVATLRDYLDRRGRLDPREALAIFLPVMRTLADAHELGLVHGALCPEELIALPGSAESFGLAAFGPEDREARSLAYLAPEQAESSVVSAPQLDVWALGVMLFEALAAERPFVGDSPPLVLVRVLTEVAPPLRQVWPDAPIALAQVVDRALRPDPSGRPASMRTFIAALTEAAARDGVAIA